MPLFQRPATALTPTSYPGADGVSSYKGYKDKGKMVTHKEKDLLTILEVAREMYARGINCLPVDLYKSHATRFIITEDGILPPLTALQGLGTAAAANIVDSRKDGEFVSIEDLKMKSGISKAVIEILSETAPGRNGQRPVILRIRLGGSVIRIL